jgi:3-deoxy-D-arabino-heptulosonate 7-phosphate (DAHP) synthase
MKTITSINNKLLLETFHCTEEEYAQRLDEEINKIAIQIHNQMLYHVKLLREIVKYQGLILDKKSNQFPTRLAKENKDINISNHDLSKVPEQPLPLSRGMRTLQSSSPLESLTEHLRLLGIKDKELVTFFI